MEIYTAANHFHLHSRFAIHQRTGSSVSPNASVPLNENFGRSAAIGCFKLGGHWESSWDRIGFRRDRTEWLRRDIREKELLLADGQCFGSFSGKWLVVFFRYVAPCTIDQALIVHVLVQKIVRSRFPTCKIFPGYNCPYPVLNSIQQIDEYSKIPTKSDVWPNPKIT